MDKTKQAESCYFESPVHGVQQVTDVQLFQNEPGRREVHPRLREERFALDGKIKPDPDAARVVWRKHHPFFLSLPLVRVV